MDLTIEALADGTVNVHGVSTAGRSFLAEVGGSRILVAMVSFSSMEHATEAKDRAQAAGLTVELGG